MKPQQKHKIYWQKQGVDSLCGLHSLNSLLQGPFFNEIELSQIALELDSKQKQLMMAQGMTKDFLKYMAEDSGNVALDGNFSVQVIEQALKRLQLSLSSIQTLNKNEDLTMLKGFICHSHAHWFSLRKIDGVWYNLNSCNKRLPEIISEFYLSAFLISVRNCGYIIFSIEGVFPQTNEEKWEYYNDNQNWYSPLRILRYHQKCVKRKNYKPNINGAGGRDKQLQKAMAQSLGKKFVEQDESSGQDSDWENPKKKQVKAFSGQAKSLGELVNVNYQKFFMDADDIELISMYKISLEETFKNQPKEGIVVSIRHSDGKKQRRFFEKEATIQQLYDYVWSIKSPNQHFYLVNSGAKEKLLDVTIPLIAIADEDGQISVIVTDQ